MRLRFVEFQFWKTDRLRQTFYRWRRKYGRMEMAAAKMYKGLKNENPELKQILAEEMLKVPRSHSIWLNATRTISPDRLCARFIF